jgi:hypothetical protein
MKPKTSTADPRSDFDKFINDLDDLLIHASAARIEVEFAPGATSSSVAATSLGLDSFQSKDSRNRSRLDSRDLATDLQEADISESLSALEEPGFSAPTWRARSHRMSGCFGLFWCQ